MYLDQYSGALAAAPDTASARTAGDLVMAWVGPLHVGNFGGNGIRAAWLLLGLATALGLGTLGEARAAPGAETTEVRDFGPDEIPWDDLAFSTVESALRDWVASLPGRGPRHEPELYVHGGDGDR